MKQGVLCSDANSWKCCLMNIADGVTNPVRQRLKLSDLNRTLMRQRGEKGDGMNLIFNIIYAAHCSGTHHKLALDALRHLKCDAHEDWQSLFLRHASSYVVGSKAPDKEFKDFKNHVLHVADNYWGGAEGKVEEWYGRLVSALREKQWQEAVYCAGVLSHYYTDPIQPFHTAQSEAESNIHRAAEWSISKSYDALWKLAEAEFSDTEIKAGSGANWLKDLVREGARYSNRYYETLIAHYDFDQGVQDPPLGLDNKSRYILASLIMYASVGFARILDKAIEEAGVEPPKIHLSAHAIIAALQIPVRWVTQKMADMSERKLVQRIYIELQQTGTVEKNLPEDDRMVRDLYAKEVLSQKERARDQRGKRIYLHQADDVEAAPSIGQKTADRLANIGIKTVGDLLAAPAEKIATSLNLRYVTERTVRDWQAQALLVCTVPGLRGHDAQLLVGCGYRDADHVSQADPNKLLSEVTEFCGTTEGQRVIRSGKMPDLAEVKDWISQAQSVRAAKAA